MSLVRIDIEKMQDIAEHLYHEIEPLRNNSDYVEGIWGFININNINISSMSDLKKRMTHNESVYSVPKASTSNQLALKTIADAIIAVMQRGFNADTEASSIINGIGQNNITYVDTTPVSFPNQYGIGDATGNQATTPVYDPSTLLSVYQQMFGANAYNIITQALTSGTSLTPELINTLEYLQSQLATQSATVNEMQASANNNGEQGGYIDNYNNYANNNGYSNNNNSTSFDDPAYSIGGGYFEMLEQLEQEANQMQNVGTGYPTYQDNYTATVNENNAASGMREDETVGNIEAYNNNTYNTTNSGKTSFLNDYLTSALTGNINANDPGVSYMSSNGGLGGAITIIDSLVEAYNNGTLNPNDPAISYLENTYGVDVSALTGNSGGTVTVQENNATSGYADNGVELVFGNSTNNNGFHDPYFDYFGNQDSGNNSNSGFHDPYFDYFGDQGNQNNNNNFHDTYFDYFGDNDSNAQTFTFQNSTQEQNNSFQNYSNQGQSDGFHDPYYDYYGIPEPSPFFNEFQQAWDTNVQNGTARADDPGAAYFNWKYGADFHI